MLRDFIVANREELVSRTKARVSTRPWPSASTDELQHGVPLFLTQLSETLRLEAGPEPFPDSAIGATAAKHGRELLLKGFTLSQVVHDYGDGGSTGTVLGRALVVVRDLVDAVLSEVRLAATTARRDRVSLLLFVDEVSVAANLHAEYREICFAVERSAATCALATCPAKTPSSRSSFRSRRSSACRPEVGSHPSSGCVAVPIPPPVLR